MINRVATPSGLSIEGRARFYAQLAFVYILTLTFMFYALRPPTDAVSAQGILQPAANKIKVSSLPPLISGKPVKIIIPASSINLPVDEGRYNQVDNSWTLSLDRAHFAMMSSQANNQSGVTFIYGHNNNNVFGALRKVTPQPGAVAQIHTDNGHIFEYAFEAAANVTPNDTSALRYSGPPILTVLTCTGSVNEWRTLYKFNFLRVVQ
jgi:LPXTG-site transpeptidase (sortase) family protein